MEESVRPVPQISTRTSCWNDCQLHCRIWKPDGPPKAILCLVHGVTEHMGRYDQLCQLLSDSGVFVFGQDLVGHGQSEGDRVHVETFDTYIQDVIHHVEEMKREHPDLPCLLMGHSMGGLIAAHVAVRRQDLFTGLILSSPALVLKVGGAVLSLVRVVVRGMAYLMPRTPLIPWDASTVSSVTEEVELFKDDIHIYHGLIRFSWVRAIMASVEEIQGSISEIRLPLLLLHGKADPTVPMAASRFAFDNVQSFDKTLEVFDGKHEVLHDREQERARVFIRDWVLAHLPPILATPSNSQS